MKYFFGNLKIGITRIFKAIKNVPHFIYISFTWECETCCKCGRHYRIIWSVKNEIWYTVFENDSDCYCLTCFIEEAEKKGIKIKAEDLDNFEFF